MLPGGPAVPALPPRTFAEAVNRGRAQLVDTRDMQAFGGGHIEGALSIGARPELSVWGGWMLDQERPILLVLERDSDLERVVALLWRIGLVRFAGYLAGGMTAWRDAGLPMRRLEQMTVQELREAGDRVQVLDVRSPSEWQAGHVPGARHRFVPELCSNLDGLDRSRPVVTYCASGYRASIAASLLQATGFTDARGAGQLARLAQRRLPGREARGLSHPTTSNELGGTAMLPATSRRVPEHTAAHVNALIREQAERSLRYHAAHPEAIERRLRELDEEWDIERALEANAASFSLLGLTLALAHDRRWLALPIGVAAFLLQHALQGWCPPVPVFRRLGFRTAAEIAEERHALKALRGDFAALADGTDPPPTRARRALDAARR